MTFLILKHTSEIAGRTWNVRSTSEIYAMARYFAADAPLTTRLPGINLPREEIPRALMCRHARPKSRAEFMGSVSARSGSPTPTPSCCTCPLAADSPFGARARAQSDADSDAFDAMDNSTRIVSPLARDHATITDIG